MKELKLYHGTCEAFVEYAKQQGGRFGPSYDTVSFTPDIEHAKSFADGWNTPRGVNRLKEMFESEVNPEHAKPVLLTFDKTKLGKLGFRYDGGEPEYYVRNGSVDLDLAIMEEV